jgi:hypothetical protein
MVKMEFISSTALFSDDNLYRFHLSRVWDQSLPKICWMMLNPSTADAEKLDPTLTRCFGYSMQWGFGSMDVVNIFAYRATSPKDMMAVSDPVGFGIKTAGSPVDNNGFLTLIPGVSALTVVGWGIHGEYKDRYKEIAALFKLRNLSVKCLGVTKNGQPRHPLYLAKDTPLEDWRLH